MFPFAGATPWWEDWPRIVETLDLTTAQDHHANIGMNAAHNDPGWGLWFQKHGMNDRTWVYQGFRDAGLKSISYYETFGTSYCVLVELGDVGDDGLVDRVMHHWAWQLYGGGPWVWTGANAWFDDLPHARPLTRTHARYGGSPMTYPDGTEATGYFGDDASDPRNIRVYDACGAKDLWGNLKVTWNYNAAINADDGTGNPVGPLDGTVYVDGQYASLANFHKDSACPHWNDYTYASTLAAADEGMDGMWTDNWSGWDSFNSSPLSYAFGEWSVARFRDYLAARFSSGELSAMGVTDVATFDVREGLKARVSDWGGNPNSAGDARWGDARWLDDDLWHAYLIYKRTVGAEALDGYYQAAKDAALDAGIGEFFICGNDIPGFSFGWVRGELDMVSTEVSTGWSLDAGTRGFMIPPFGRLTPRYKLGREHAKSRFVNVWLYTDHNVAALEKPGLATAMYYELLPAHTLPMFHPGNTRVAGTEASNQAFFGFVEAAAPSLGGRLPVEDVGIFYSSSDVVMQMTPRGYYSHNEQGHQFACYGWGTALGEAQYQYRYVPEWKLTREVLDQLRLFIIPHAAILDPDLATEAILPWVADGGKLIITGDCGTRLGEDGNFAANPGGSPLAAITGAGAPANVWHMTSNWGMDFFLDDTGRAAKLAALLPTLNTFMNGEPERLVAATENIPDTMGLNLHADVAAGRYFADLNNFDFDLATDTPVPTPQVVFDLDLPAWLPAPTVSVLSPDAAPQVSIQVIAAGKARLTVGSFSNYVSLVLENSTPSPAPTKPAVWVAPAFTGLPLGLALHPFTTFADGTGWVGNGGDVNLAADVTTGPVSLNRAMRLVACSGSVRLGE